MNWFEKAFDALPDPRTGNATRHELLEILTIALTATICGAESCSDFADFTVDRENVNAGVIGCQHAGAKGSHLLLRSG
ncbi:MAG: transposase family protein, partial [Rhodospirillaceae bacterium]